MIRHIVLFKFKSQASQDERSALAAQLESLKQEIGNIRSLKVAWDVGKKPNSYDLALDSTFDTMEDVEEYAVHPSHVKVLETVKQVCESTVKVDYEEG